MSDKHTVDAEHWMWLYAESQPGVTNAGRWLATLLAEAIGRHKVMAEMAEAARAVASEYPPEGLWPQQALAKAAELIQHDDGTRPEEFGPEFEKVTVPIPSPMVQDYLENKELPPGRDEQPDGMLTDDFDPSPIDVWDLPKAKDGGRVEPLKSDNPCRRCQKWIKAGQRSYFRTNDDGEKEYYHAYHFIQNYR